MLTKPQQKVLDTLKSYHKKNGFMPSIREIGDEMGGISTNAVHNFLIILERKKFIKRLGNKARAITIL